MLPEHARQVAQLHIEGIHTGFISSLGLPFVTALYSAISESPYGFGYVQKEGAQVVGFVAFTTNLKGLYKTICLKKGIRFFFLLASKMFSFRTVKKIFETIFYPQKTEQAELPAAELLSIAVSETQRGKGVAKQLIRYGLHQCKDNNIDKVKVLVADFNKPANALYQSTGFQFVTTIESHGIVSNIYVADTDDCSHH